MPLTLAMKVPRGKEGCVRLSELRRYRRKAPRAPNTIHTIEYVYGKI